MSHFGDILKKAGLKVVDKPVKGRPLPYGEVRGIMLHHTGGHNPSDLGVVTKGRAGLPGPLCQLYVAPDGTWHVITEGRANHAGAGSWNKNGLVIPQDRGNQFLIGIEISSMGSPITGEQYASVIKGVSALCKAYKWNANKIIRHRDYAPKRKDDIKNSLATVRLDVSRQLEIKPKPTPKPVKKSTYPLRGIKIFGYQAICNPITKLRTVGKSPHIVTIQKKLKVTPATGYFGSKTYFAVKRFQKSKKLRDNGFVDKQTWDALGL